MTKKYGNHEISHQECILELNSNYKSLMMFTLLVFETQILGFDLDLVIFLTATRHFSSKISEEQKMSSPNIALIVKMFLIFCQSRRRPQTFYNPLRVFELNMNFKVTVTVIFGRKIPFSNLFKLKIQVRFKVSIEKPENNLYSYVITF